MPRREPSKKARTARESRARSARLAESRAVHGAADPVDPAVSHQAVWFRLLKLSNMITRPFFVRFAEQYDLSINDWRIIMALASMSEAASHELCDVTGMHPMNVSRSVAVLRRQERITERRDPNNRRRKLLTLTAKGWAVYRLGIPQVKRLSDYLFAAMSPIEVEFLGRLIDLLIGRMESVDPANPLIAGPEPVREQR